MYLQVFLYIALAVFVAANLYRFIRIGSMPVHLRWELYPVPHESRRKRKYGGSYLEETDWWTKPVHSSKIGELGVMLPEIFLLKGVWEHNRTLWLWSWLFHTGLYLMIGALGLLVLAVLFSLTGVAEFAARGAGFGSLLYNLTTSLLWISGIIGVVGAVGTLMMRLFARKLRSFLSLGTVFNLALIGGLFVTVLWSLKGNANASGDLFRMMHGILTGSQLAASSTPIVVFAAWWGAFLLYFPFTHMTHAYTKFYTYHSIRWDDRPLVKEEKLQRRIQKSLESPVSWAAPHIKGDGKKNWVQVAVEETAKDA